MKNIVVDKENVDSGFDKLIESRLKGEFAVWEFGGYTTTTDDVPANVETMDRSEVIRQMKVQAIDRHEKYSVARDKYYYNQSKSI